MINTGRSPIACRWASFRRNWFISGRGKTFVVSPPLSRLFCAPGLFLLSLTTQHPALGREDGKTLTHPFAACWWWKRPVYNWSAILLISNTHRRLEKWIFMPRRIHPSVCELAKICSSIPSGCIAAWRGLFFIYLLLQGILVNLFYQQESSTATHEYIEFCREKWYESFTTYPELSTQVLILV